MKNRFFSEEPLVAGTEIVLRGDEAHHVRVSRLRDGEEVEIFDRNAANAVAVFLDMTKDSARFRVERLSGSREPQSPIELALALIQPEKFELVLQKATELGVARIIPMLTERCEVRPERVAGKAERWHKIVLEAAKQCGRSRVPPIEPLASFEAVLARPGSLLMFEGELAESPGRAGEEPLTVLVGPEGGWSEGEVERAREAGCGIRRLGPRRLRAETAAIAALVVAGLERGDLGSR